MWGPLGWAVRVNPLGEGRSRGLSGARPSPPSPPPNLHISGIAGDEPAPSRAPFSLISDGWHFI